MLTHLRGAMTAAQIAWGRTFEATRKNAPALGGRSTYWIEVPLSRHDQAFQKVEPSGEGAMPPSRGV